MSWLPRLRLIGATICERDGESEGTTLQLRWRHWLIELTFARWAGAADAR